MSRLKRQSKYDIDNREKGDVSRRAVLAFIIDYKLKHDGCAPSVREIGKGCDLLSTNTVAYYLADLEEDDLIILNGIRGIQVVGGQWTFQGDNNDEEGAYPVPALRKHEVQESA
jgi:SOS-response transcriptional repressor LexA